MIKVGRNVGNGKEILPTNEKSLGKTDGICDGCGEKFECEFDHIPDGWGLVMVTLSVYRAVCSKACHEIVKDRLKMVDNSTIMS